MEIGLGVSLLVALINFFMIYILLGSIHAKMAKKSRLIVSVLSAMITMIFFLILSFIAGQVAFIPSNL